MNSGAFLNKFGAGALAFILIFAGGAMMRVARMWIHTARGYGNVEQVGPGLGAWFVLVLGLAVAMAGPLALMWLLGYRPVGRKGWAVVIVAALLLGLYQGFGSWAAFKALFIR
jgi:hypothetical protein